MPTSLAGPGFNKENNFESILSGAHMNGSSELLSPSLCSVAIMIVAWTILRQV